MYIDIIKEKYPIATRVEYIFKNFHGTIMGAEPDKLEEFLKEFEDSEMKSLVYPI